MKNKKSLYYILGAAAVLLIVLVVLIAGVAVVRSEKKSGNDTQIVKDTSAGSEADTQKPNGSEADSQSGTEADTQKPNGTEAGTDTQTPNGSENDSQSGSGTGNGGTGSQGGNDTQKPNGSENDGQNGSGNGGSQGGAGNGNGGTGSQGGTGTQNPTGSENDGQGGTGNGGTGAAHTHSYEEKISMTPSCERKGEKTFICSCGDSYTESIAALGHTFDSWSYNDDATYEADGTETAFCTKCGAESTRKKAGTKMEKTIAQLKEEAVEQSVKEFRLNKSDPDYDPKWNYDNEDGSPKEYAPEELYVATTRWVYDGHGHKCLWRGYYVEVKAGQLFSEEHELGDDIMGYMYNKSIDILVSNLNWKEHDYIRFYGKELVNK